MGGGGGEPAVGVDLDNAGHISADLTGWRSHCTDERMPNERKALAHGSRMTVDLRWVRIRLRPLRACS